MVGAGGSPPLPAQIVLTRWSWLPRLTLPALCCSRSTAKAPHGRLAAPAGYIGHRGGAGLYCRASGSLAYPAWFWLCRSSGLRQAPARKRIRCWPAPSCIRSFPAESRKEHALLRAFFGGRSGEALLGEADDQAHRARPSATEPHSGPVAGSRGNGGAPLASVTATICRRPPGPYGGVGVDSAALCPVSILWEAPTTGSGSPTLSVRVGLTGAMCSRA